MSVEFVRSHQVVFDVRRPDLPSLKSSELVMAQDTVCHLHFRLVSRYKGQFIEFPGWFVRILVLVNRCTECWSYCCQASTHKLLIVIASMLQYIGRRTSKHV